MTAKMMGKLQPNEEKRGKFLIYYQGFMYDLAFSPGGQVRGFLWLRQEPADMLNHPGNQYLKLLK